VGDAEGKKTKDEGEERGRESKRKRAGEGETEKDYFFTAQRQRESFSLKAPFCPGSVFRFESNLPRQALCYVYLPYANPTDRQKKAPDSLRFPGEVNSECEA